MASDIGFAEFLRLLRRILSDIGFAEPFLPLRRVILSLLETSSYYVRWHRTSALPRFFVCYVRRILSDIGFAAFLRLLRRILSDIGFAEFLRLLRRILSDIGFAAPFLLLRRILSDNGFAEFFLPLCRVILSLLENSSYYVRWHRLCRVSSSITPDTSRHRLCLSLRPLRLLLPQY